MGQEQSPAYHSAGETAKILGCTERMLQYYRETGRIQGTRIGRNWCYSDAQIAAYDPEPRKSGRKPVKKEESAETAEEGALSPLCV